jgi:hypothetical protein
MVCIVERKLMTSMVSDTTTDPLIYWSDSGDSFFGELARA